MIEFHGGPADAKRIWLRRAPVFLRVTIDPEGGFDALDQPDDVARQDEVIYVYRRVGKVSRGIACSRGSGCQPFAIATYEWYGPHSPADAVLRDNATWRQWAEAEYARQQTPTAT